jgi:DNA-binding NtrC family response regulator
MVGVLNTRPVMVIAEDARVCRTLEKALTDARLWVEVCDNADAGLERTKDLDPSLVLLGQRLTLSSGETVEAELDRISGRRIPIVLTASNPPTKELAPGPIDLDDLVRLVVALVSDESPAC